MLTSLCMLHSLTFSGQIASDSALLRAAGSGTGCVQSQKDGSQIGVPVRDGPNSLS